MVRVFGCRVQHQWAFANVTESNRRYYGPADGEAVALEGLSECRLTTDETETGATHLHRALEIYQRLGMAPDTGAISEQRTAAGTAPVAAAAADRRYAALPPRRRAPAATS